MSSKENESRLSRSKKSPVHRTIRPQSNSPSPRISHKKSSEPLLHLAVNNQNSSNKTKKNNASNKIDHEDDDIDSDDSSGTENQLVSKANIENLPNLDEVAVFVKTEKSNDIYKCLKCKKVWNFKMTFSVFYRKLFFTILSLKEALKSFLYTLRYYDLQLCQPICFFQKS